MKLTKSFWDLTRTSTYSGSSSPIEELLTRCGRFFTKTNQKYVVIAPDSVQQDLIDSQIYRKLRFDFSSDNKFVIDLSWQENDSRDLNEYFSDLSAHIVEKGYTCQLFRWKDLRRYYAARIAFKHKLISKGEVIVRLNENDLLDMIILQRQSKINNNFEFYGSQKVNISDYLCNISTFHYSQPPPRSKEKHKHPATFPEKDVEFLLRNLLSNGCLNAPPPQVLLDPFVGTGSSLLGSSRVGLKSLGIELTDSWVKIAINRLGLEPSDQVVINGVNYKLNDEMFISDDISLVQGDSQEVLPQLPEESFSIVFTSPPYWRILNKPADHKSKRERLSKGLPTTYSTHSADLGNILDYSEFLKKLEKVWEEVFRIIVPGGLLGVVLVNFRQKSFFFPYIGDTARLLGDVGFKWVSEVVWAQDNKRLYPYGFPYSYVVNIHHQSVLIFRKPLL